MQTKRSSKPAKVVLIAVFTLVLVTVLVGSAVAVVLGWSSSVDEGDVVIGEAARAKTTIKLPELKNGKILPPGQWPSACELVDQEDVKAILPEAKEIQQETPQVITLTVKEFAADPEWRKTDHAEAGQCLYSMRLPGETYQATHLWIRIHAIADPELIKRYYDSQTLGVGTNQGAHGADNCAITGLAEGNWICRKGPLMFTVGGQTTVAFKGKPAPAPFVWRDDVNPQIVETVAAKIR